jgi:hypothetical protein
LFDRENQHKVNVVDFFFCIIWMAWQLWCEVVVAAAAAASSVFSSSFLRALGELALALVELLLALEELGLALAHLGGLLNLLLLLGELLLALAQLGLLPLELVVALDVLGGARLRLDADLDNVAVVVEAKVLGLARVLVAVLGAAQAVLVAALDVADDLVANAADLLLLGEFLASVLALARLAQLAALANVAHERAAQIANNVPIDAAERLLEARVKLLASFASVLLENDVLENALTHARRARRRRSPALAVRATSGILFDSGSKFINRLRLRLLLLLMMVMLMVTRL